MTAPRFNRQFDRRDMIDAAMSTAAGAASNGHTFARTFTAHLVERLDDEFGPAAVNRAAGRSTAWRWRTGRADITIPMAFDVTQALFGPGR